MSACNFCSGQRIKLKPCANGDNNLEAIIIDNGIVILKYGLALGYFDIAICPFCGKELLK